MSEENERKFIHFMMQKAEVRALGAPGVGAPGSRLLINCTLVADTNQYELWQTVSARMQAPGIKVYEDDGIVGEAMTLLQNDLEKEKQRYADLERSKMAREVEDIQLVVNLRSELAAKERELLRLHAMEKKLEKLAGLTVQKGGKIGP